MDESEIRALWFRMPMDDPEEWRWSKRRLSVWQRFQINLYRWSHWYE